MKMAKTTPQDEDFTRFETSCTLSTSGKHLIHTFHGHEVFRCIKTRLFNATDMCDAVGAKFEEFSKTSEFFGAEIYLDMSGIDRKSIIQRFPTLNQTWVHRDIARALFEWCNKKREDMEKLKAYTRCTPVLSTSKTATQPSNSSLTLPPEFETAEREVQIKMMDCVKHLKCDLVLPQGFLSFTPTVQIKMLDCIEKLGKCDITLPRRFYTLQPKIQSKVLGYMKYMKRTSLDLSEAFFILKPDEQVPIIDSMYKKEKDKNKKKSIDLENKKKKNPHDSKQKSKEENKTITTTTTVTTTTNPEPPILVRRIPYSGYYDLYHHVYASAPSTSTKTTTIVHKK